MSAPASSSSSSSSSNNIPSSPGQVLVIGGGIAGCAAALFLQKLGMHPVVFEAYAQDKVVVGGGMQIAPNGVNVLKFLDGMDQTLLARGAEIQRYVMRNHTGAVLAAVDLQNRERFGAPAIACSRRALHDTLVGALAAAKIPIFYEKRLATIEQSDSEPIVTAVFADGTRVSGSFLIGADGIHSPCRQALFPEAPKPFYLDLMGFGGFVPVDQLAPVAASLPKAGDMEFVFGPRGFWGQSSGPKDAEGRETMMWWSNMPDLDGKLKEEAPGFSNEKIREMLNEQHGGWFEPIPQVIAADSVSPPQRITRNFIHDVADLEQWHKGRCILIGDAAHAFSPNSGQGASQALEDTMLLAKLLRDSGVAKKLAEENSSVVVSTPQLFSVFAKFQEARKPRVDRINHAARKMADSKKVSGPWTCWFRDQFMKLLFKFMGHSLFTKEFAFKIDWEERTDMTQ